MNDFKLLPGRVGIVIGVLLLVMAGAVAVIALARRWGYQAGLVVMVAAGGVSFLPGVPRLELDPEVILGVVMPLLVYSAAAQFSFVRFVRDLRSILTLGVGLVLATTGCVGLVTAWLVPGWGLAAAFVLAAVVSPPDTVTAVTHGAEIGLPRRVTSVLGGETLVNDATALTVFALAVAAATRSRAFIASPVLLFGYETAAGIATGLLFGAAAVWARTRLREARLEAVIGLLVPFAAYWAAEQARASGVLAVVMAGFSVSVNTSFAGRAHRSPDTYRTRLTEAALWPVIDTLLEAFVFAAMGLQLHAVVTGIPAGDRPTTITVSAAVLGTVIAVRFAWVLVTFGRRRLSGTLEQRAHAASPRLQALAGPGHPGRGELLGWPEMILVSWTGMRGVVTLAAAGGVPLTTSSGPFPGRDTIQAAAFAVTAGTLLLQGFTLPALARALAIDTSADQQHEQAGRAEAARLAGEAAPGGAVTAADFDRQRDALTRAVVGGTLDDDIADAFLHRIDLRQAALSGDDDESG